MGVLVKNVPDYKQQPTYLGEPCATTESSTSPSRLPAAGLVVVRVVCDGPAAKAGIVPGDTIVAVDGYAVTNNDSSLPDILGRLRPGDIARVKIVGVSGVTSTLKEKLGAIPS
jgi:S1-C subfamily serine protease